MPSIFSNFSNDYIEPNLFWPMLIILTIVIITLIYMFTLPLPFPEGFVSDDIEPRKHPLTPDDEFLVINRIEDTIIEWLAVVVFLITLAVILRRLDKNIYFSIIFLIIAFVTSIVLNLDYIQHRRRAAESGYETTWRMNYLFYIVLIIITIITFILHDIVRDNFYRPKGTYEPVNNISV